MRRTWSTEVIAETMSSPAAFFACEAITPSIMPSDMERADSITMGTIRYKRALFVNRVYFVFCLLKELTMPFYGGKNMFGALRPFLPSPYKNRYLPTLLSVHVTRKNLKVPQPCFLGSCADVRA